jgi:hypothetical protein
MNPDILNHHGIAVAGAIALSVFGYFVLAYDTGHFNNPRYSSLIRYTYQIVYHNEKLTLAYPLSL